MESNYKVTARMSYKTNESIFRDKSTALRVAENYMTLKDCSLVTISTYIGTRWLLLEDLTLSN